MVAMQLAKEPLVQQCVRQTFQERAKLNVKPTKKGMKEIDESHPCFKLKWLKNKPVRDLVGPSFLHLSNVSFKSRCTKIKYTSTFTVYLTYIWKKIELGDV